MEATLSFAHVIWTSEKEKKKKKKGRHLAAALPSSFTKLGGADRIQYEKLSVLAPLPLTFFRPDL